MVPYLILNSLEYMGNIIDLGFLVNQTPVAFNVLCSLNAVMRPSLFSVVNWWYLSLVILTRLNNVYLSPATAILLKI